AVPSATPPRCILGYRSRELISVSNYDQPRPTTELVLPLNLRSQHAAHRNRSRRPPTLCASFVFGIVSGTRSGTA
ncbi:MAG: hypothetical protein ACM3ZE_23875, partial [Myxococcales bacterium]